MSQTLPPRFIKIPPTIAHAEVEEAVAMTMIRILELSWDHNRYKGTAPYTPDQLAELLGRTRPTLYRHLSVLRELKWIGVKREMGRRITIRILIPILDDDQVQKAEEGEVDESPWEGVPAGKQTGPFQSGRELRQALTEVGIIGRKLRELLERDLDPAVVRAWHLWTWHPDQDWLDNAAGYVINRLEQGDEPLAEFLEIARLAPEEIATLEEAYRQGEEYQRWPSLAGREKLQRLAPLWAEVYRAMTGRRPESYCASEPAEPTKPDREIPDLLVQGRIGSRQLWQQALGELSLQMTRATFDTWLRGSWIAGYEPAGEDDGHKEQFIVQVRNAYAVDWLAARLNATVARVLARLVDSPVEVQFRA